MLISLLNPLQPGVAFLYPPPPFHYLILDFWSEILVLRRLFPLIIYQNYQGGHSLIIFVLGGGGPLKCERIRTF